MKRILLEGILVAAIGLLVALAANALSPRGLKLARNYFPNDHVTVPDPGKTNPPPSNLVASNGSHSLPATNPASPARAIEARLAAKGISLAQSNRVWELFQDPRREQGLVAFIDARDEPQYKKGHVPGAYLLDYYRPENYLPTVLPVSQIAEHIVIYCNGGDCEDSELTANLLSTAGIAVQKLVVYGGGWHEWLTNRWPVEIGDRLSGIITNTHP